MRKLLVVAALCAAALPGAAASARGPTTLALTRGPIGAFAQDGERIAWASAEPAGGCAWLVRVRDLNRRVQTAVNRPGGPTCRHDNGFDLGHWAAPHPLALARDRALWRLVDSGNFVYLNPTTGAPADARDASLEEITFPSGSNSNFLVMAGDGATLVYGWYEDGIEEVDDRCLGDGTCPIHVQSGRVERVVGQRHMPVPGIGPVGLVAASGLRIAVLPHGAVGAPPPARFTRVDVRNVLTGALLGGFDASGSVRALAFSGDRVAAMTRATIEVYSVAGARLRLSAVPAGAASELSLSGTRAVFRVGNTISVLDTATGRVGRVAIAAATPIGLSIEGNRVAWAENVRIRGTLRGRVRAVTI